MPTLDEQTTRLDKYRQHELEFDRRTILLFAIATVVIPIVALSICLLIHAAMNQSVRINPAGTFSAIVLAIPFSAALAFFFSRWWVSLTSRFYLFEGRLNIAVDRSAQPIKYWLCILMHGLLLLVFAALAIFPSIAVVYPTMVGVTPFE